MDEDDRLMPILSHLSVSFLTNISASDNNFFGDNDGDTDKVTADMVDGLAQRHFPACQYHLWKRLKKDRHLKHHARLQFGLFLKVSLGCWRVGRGGTVLHADFDGWDEITQALGLPLDEALVYWRRAFGISMTDDKFSKEYKYNIRHSYGQEGGRKNYPAKR